MGKITEKRIIESFFKFSIGPWLSAFISFLSTPVITWLIIPEEFGKAAMFQIAYSFLLVSTGLGADQSFIRFFYEKSATEKPALLFQSIIPTFVSGLIATALILSMWRFTSNVILGKEALFPIIALSIMIFIGNIERFSSLVLRMKNRGIAYSMVRVIFSFTNVIFIILYAFTISRDFTAVVFGLLGSTCISMIVSIVLEKELWKTISSACNFSYLKTILTYGIPFVPTFIIYWIFQSIDKIFLRNFTTFSEIGLYSTAFKMALALRMIQVGFTTFWTPMAYENYHKNPDSTYLYEKAFNMIASIMLILGLMLILFRDLIVLILAGSYHDIIYIMPFLLFIPIMYTISEVVVIGINIKQKTHWHIWIAIIALSANFFLNLFLVPIYGAKGAAISIGISYVILFYSRTFVSMKLFPMKIEILKFTIATFVFISTAFVTTFYTSRIFCIFTSLISMAIIVIIYKKELIAAFASLRIIIKGFFTNLNQYRNSEIKEESS